MDTCSRAGLGCGHVFSMVRWKNKRHKITSWNRHPITCGWYLWWQRMPWVKSQERQVSGWVFFHAIAHPKRDVTGEGFCSQVTRPSKTAPHRRWVSAGTRIGDVCKTHTSGAPSGDGPQFVRKIQRKFPYPAHIHFLPVFPFAGGVYSVVGRQSNPVDWNNRLPGWRLPAKEKWRKLTLVNRWVAASIPRWGLWCFVEEQMPSDTQTASIVSLPQCIPPSTCNRIARNIISHRGESKVCCTGTSTRTAALDWLAWPKAPLRLLAVRGLESWAFGDAWHFGRCRGQQIWTSTTI